MNNTVKAADLKAEMLAILSKLEGLIAQIANALGRPATLDTPSVNLKVAEVNALAHRFLLFLPGVVQARAKAVEAAGKMDSREQHEWAEITSRVLQARTWVSSWTLVERVIRQQVPPKRQPLYRRKAKTEPIVRGQLSLADGIFNEIHALLGQTAQDHDAQAFGCFADIGLPQSMFIEHLHAAYRVSLVQARAHPTRFIDVGCGGGLKVLSAATFFPHADGLEYDPGYVAAAQSLFTRAARDDCNVIHADALTYDGYDQYDVIYFYRPMRDPDMLLKLEQQIIRTARPGTLIIAPYMFFDHRYKQHGCALIADRLYVTAKTQKEANALRRAAELTGVSIVHSKPDASGIWEPILEVSRARGFGPESFIEGYSTQH